MSNIVNDLRTYLISKSAVTSLTSTRVYKGELPQNASMPAIALNLIDSNSYKNMQSADGLRRSSIQIDCYGTSTGGAPYESAYTVADKVRLVTEMYRGTMGASTVRRAMVEDQRDFIDEPMDGEEFSRRGRSLDLVIWHTESTST